MAQWRKDQQQYRPENNTNFEVFVAADQYGNIIGDNGSSPASKSSFGEISTVTTTPVFQLDGIYGVSDTDDFALNSSLSGTYSVDSNGLFTVSSGVTSYAFATLRSKRAIRYRPGQGSVARFTAMWPTGYTPGYQQVAGYINQSDGLSIGYNYGDPGVDATKRQEFAIVRRSYSKAEIFQVEITGAAGSAQTATITLNGVAHNVSLTNASGNTNFTAAELGVATYAGWIVDYVDSKVNFLYDGPPIDLVGVFSFATDGDATATTTTLQNGSPPNDEWIYQSDFNIDKLDGTGPSGMTIDTTKLNVFQIDFRWLGAGIARFAIEDANTGNLFTFHQMHYVNTNTKSHLSNPSMRVGYGVVNFNPAIGTGTDVVVKGGSIVGGIQGPIVINRTASSSTTTITTNLAQDIIHHILTIKNDRINETGTSNIINQRELLFNNLSAGVTATAAGLVTIEIFKNAFITDAVPNDVNYIYTVVRDGISQSITTGRLKANTGKLITTFVASTGSNVNIDLRPYRIILAPEETLSIFFTSSSQLTRSVAGMTYIEE